MAEFDLIRRLQQIICESPETRFKPVLGIGDDAAILEVPPEHQLVVTTDTLLEGTHFFSNTSPRDLGHKALAVNLSDLAAMGAEPAWFFLALTLPELNSGWLDEFALGIAGLASDSGIHLAGGDTTSGPLSVTITAMGLVEQGGALTRSGAVEGDLVAISGTLGDAALAVSLLQSGATPEKASLEALNHPEPRLELGQRLRGLATSCIDISDGLVADLGHILKQSGVGADIQLADLPFSEILENVGEAERWDYQLTGGDDYELCFTIAPTRLAEMERIMIDIGLPLTVIGRITHTEQLALKTPSGGVYHPAGRAYEHFALPIGGTS